MKWFRHKKRLPKNYRQGNRTISTSEGCGLIGLVGGRKAAKTSLGTIKSVERRRQSSSSENPEELRCKYGCVPRTNPGFKSVFLNDPVLSYLDRLESMGVDEVLKERIDKLRFERMVKLVYIDD